MQARTEWSRADVARLSQARPPIVYWTFATGSAFEDGALEALDAPRLRMLTFQDSDLTGSNLLALSRFPKLTRLSIGDCRFAAADFAALCKTLAVRAATLTEFWLENTPVDDDLLGAVGEMTRLQWLILSGTAISDAGLEHLHGLTKLGTLWMERTPVTDAGVLGLAVLPRLTGVPTRETGCSANIEEQLFRAQMRLQASPKPAEAAQLDAGDVRLQEFLRQREAWERSAYQTACEIEARFKAQRPESHVLSEEESRANDRFWQDINRQKAQIAERFCTRALRARGAGAAQSYGDPPQLVAQTSPWVLAETPSRTKTVFVGVADAQPVYREWRYTLKWEHEDWFVDEVQHWSGGWKRHLV